MKEGAKVSSTTGFQDLVGNPLDGEWTNPATPTTLGSSNYPSGNGAAGGDFAQRFSVLAGDCNHDGRLTIRDLVMIRNAAPGTPEAAMADVNADGRVGRKIHVSSNGICRHVERTKHTEIDDVICMAAMSVIDVDGKAIGAREIDGIECDVSVRVDGDRAVCRATLH